MFDQLRRYYLLVKKKFGRKPKLINIGNFWCERHFRIILDSQATDDPIDYHIATMGVGRFITLATDHETEGPLAHACERIPSEIREQVLVGIFQRSKGWLPPK